MVLASRFATGEAKPALAATHSTGRSLVSSNCCASVTRRWVSQRAAVLPVAAP